MRDRVDALLREMPSAALAGPREAASCLRRHAWLKEATRQELEWLLIAWLEQPTPAPHSTAEALQAAVLAQLSHGFRRQMQRDGAALSSTLRDRMVTLYRQWGPGSHARHELLTLLAVAHGAEDLQALAELAASDPPAAPQMFLTPLFQFRDYAPEALFPRLLDALAHLPLAAPILDLTNFLTRERRVAAHPATAQSGRLAQLLGDLSQSLGRIEEQPPEPAEVEATHRRVNEGVSLAVSLCDALALIGDPSHVGKLYQAMELPHRRIRTEAAYALAKLGEKAGQEALLALAAEPVARLRVLAYAEELGVLDQVEERFRNAPARAEAELVSWLSDPTQMGLPPGQCELIDQRTQYWPGYDDPVACFLFHFEYRLGEAAYANVGIVGPMVHAMTADLGDLPPDDIYAAYAGWQAEHEDIYEVEARDLTGSAQFEAERLVRRLRDAGYTNVEPLRLGFFFEDRVLIAHATRDGVPGYAVTDAQTLDWRPAAPRPRPLGPVEMYCIYKGRKLLKAFNEETGQE